MPWERKDDFFGITNGRQRRNITRSEVCPANIVTLNGVDIKKRKSIDNFLFVEILDILDKVKKTRKASKKFVIDHANLAFVKSSAEYGNKITYNE